MFNCLIIDLQLLHFWSFRYERAVPSITTRGAVRPPPWFYDQHLHRKKTASQVRKRCEASLRIWLQFVVNYATSNPLKSSEMADLIGEYTELLQQQVKHRVHGTKQLGILSFCIQIEMRD